MNSGSEIVWKGSFRVWLATLGPTAVLASIAMGPGTIGSNLAVGSKLGYDLAWLVVLATVMSVANLYAVGKMSAVTGLSLLEQFAAFFHPAVSWVIGGLMLLTLLLIVPFTGVTLGHTLNLLIPSLPPFLGMTICTALIVYVYIFGGGFRFVSLLCTVLVALMCAAFLANALVVGPDLAGLARGVFVPTLPQGYESTLLAVGIIGGSVSIVGSLFQGYSVRNARWSVRQVPAMAWDVFVFTGLLFLVFSLSILVSGVALAGKPVHDAAQAAAALEPVAGPAARWIFATGYFIATFTTLAAASYLGGYIAHDFFKWPLRGELHADLRFRLVCAGLLTTVFLAPLFAPLFPPIYLIIFGTALFAIGTPPVLLLVLILGRRKSVYGVYRLGTALTAVLGVSLLVSAYSAYLLIARVLGQFQAIG